MIKKYKNVSYQHLRCLIALLMISSLLLSPFFTKTVYAADNYAKAQEYMNSSATKNGSYCSCGVAIGSGTHWCCWNYASNAYKYIWGTTFDRTNSNNNYLRNVSAANRTMTVEHLKQYFSSAASGANFRMDSDSVPGNGDNNGHSMIFLKVNESKNGAYFLEGNYEKGKVRIYNWSWNDLVSTYGPSSKYKYNYIKYIMWPNAPEYNNAPIATQPTISSEYSPYDLYAGKSWDIGGKISSNVVLETVGIRLRSLSGNVVFSKWVDPQSTSYNLENLNPLPFDELSPGIYTYEVFAKNSKFDVKLVDHKLIVLNTWCPIDEGVYSFRAMDNNGMTLDVQGHSNTSGGNIFLNTYENDDYQKFNLIKNGYGWYVITNCGSELRLDVAGARKTNGTNIQQCANSGSDAQLWQFIPAAGENTYFLVPGHAHYMALDLQGANVSEGTNIQLYEANASTAQMWVLTKEETSEPTITSINDATVTGIDDAMYTGSAIEPTPVVKLGDKTLVKDTDYTVSYSNNINVGTANVTITGKGIYTGTIEKTFKIIIESNEDAAVFTVGSVRATASETVTVPVSISNNSGIASFALKVNADPELTLTGVESTDLFTGTYTINTDDAYIVLVGTQNNTAEGVLLNLQFAVAEGTEAGSYSVSVIYADGKPENINNEDGDMVPASFVDGKVEVIAYRLGDVNIDTKITAQDATILQRSLAHLVTLSDVQKAAADVNGDTKITAQDATILSRYLAHLISVFPAESRGPARNLIRAVGRNANAADGKLVVGTAEGKAGDTIEIPVSLTENPGISSMNIHVTYDTEAMTLKSIETGSDFSIDMTTNPEGGYFNWTKTKNITTTGEMAVLTFEINSEAKAGEYAVSVIYADDEIGNICDENADPVILEYTDGKVTVKSAEHQHILESVEAKEATCAEDGYEAYWKCDDCGKLFSDAEGTAEIAAPVTISAKGHKLTAVLKKAATCTEDGYEGYWKCDTCSKLFSDSKGKTQIDTPSIIKAIGHTWDGGKVTKEPTAEETGIRTYTCSVCRGTRTEEISNEAQKKKSKDSVSAENVEKEVTSMPDNGEAKSSVYGKLQAKASKVGKNYIKLTWKKVSGTDGYTVYANACGKKNKLIKIADSMRGTSLKVTEIDGKKLKKNTYYKFLIVSHAQKDGYSQVLSTSKTIHVATTGGKFANPKKVTAKVSGGKAKLKKKTVTVKKGKAFTIKAKVSKTKGKKLKKHRKISFESSDTDVVTVSSKGKVKTKARGKATIYVYAQNGVCLALKVTVK